MVDNGGLCVMITGTPMMPRLSADSWDMMWTPLVHVSICVSTGCSLM